MAYDKTRMQDIKLSELSLFQEYNTLWSNLDINGISNFINNHPEMKYKIFNAYNWNRLINSINDETDLQEATEDSLVGAWKNDYGKLINTSKNFKYAGLWELGKQYYKNYLVKFNDYRSYFCIQDNLSTEINMPPNLAYWLPAESFLGLIGIPVVESPPSDMLEGDIYFQIISSE